MSHIGTWEKTKFLLAICKRNYCTLVEIFPENFKWIYFATISYYRQNCLMPTNKMNYQGVLVILTCLWAIFIEDCFAVRLSNFEGRHFVFNSFCVTSSLNVIVSLIKLYETLSAMYKITFELSCEGKFSHVDWSGICMQNLW